MRERDEGLGRNARRWIRALVLLTVLAVLLVLVYANIAPFGAEVVLRVTPGGETERVRFTRPFTTTSDLGRDGEGVLQVPRLKMTTNQVTFDLEVPYRDFKSMQAKIRYRGDPDELDMGVLKDPGNYKYVPIHNASLNRLEWDSVSSEGVTLYQRDKKYDSVAEFVNALPGILEQQMASGNRVRVASYFYNPVQPDPAIDRSSVSERSSIDNTLRGSHVFYLYSPGGPFKLSFGKLELNDYQGADPLTLTLYDRSGNLVATRLVPDDGDESDDRKPSGPKKVDWSIESLPAGTCRLEMICDNDVLMRKIQCYSRYLCAAERLFLADNYIYNVGPSKPATLYTDAINLTAEIWNQEAAQSITINNALNLPLLEVFNPVMVTLLPGTKTVDVQTGSVMLDAPGCYFSFEEGSLFDPFPVKTLDYYSRVNQAMYDYVIAGYSEPRDRGGWLEQSVTMDIEDVNIADNRISFSLSAPRLAEKHKEVLIDYLQINLRR